MKILRDARYDYLVDCAKKYTDYLAGPLVQDPQLYYERGLVDAGCTEREQFIIKLRAAFLDKPTTVKADLLKEYDCKTGRKGAACPLPR